MCGVEGVTTCPCTLLDLSQGVAILKWGSGHENLLQDSWASLPGEFSSQLTMKVRLTEVHHIFIGTIQMAACMHALHGHIHSLP